LIAGMFTVLDLIYDDEDRLVFDPILLSTSLRSDSI